MSIGDFPIIVTMNGYKTDLREDLYQDGTKCFVASHPELEECVAYGDTPSEALRLLDVARSVSVEFDARHGSSKIDRPSVIMLGGSRVPEHVTHQSSQLTPA